jgi:hypothetical protein
MSPENREAFPLIAHLQEQSGAVSDNTEKQFFLVRQRIIG